VDNTSKVAPLLEPPSSSASAAGAGGLEEKLKNNSLLNYLREKAQKKLFSKKVLKEKLKKEKLALKDKTKVFFFFVAFFVSAVCVIIFLLSLSRFLSFLLTERERNEKEEGCNPKE
jgi:hypothetical protein